MSATLEGKYRGVSITAVIFFKIWNDLSSTAMPTPNMSVVKSLGSCSSGPIVRPCRLRRMCSKASATICGPMIALLMMAGVDAGRQSLSPGCYSRGSLVRRSFAQERAASSRVVAMILRPPTYEQKTRCPPPGTANSVNYSEAWLDSKQSVSIMLVTDIPRFRSCVQTSSIRDRLDGPKFVCDLGHQSRWAARSVVEITQNVERLKGFCDSVWMLCYVTPH